MKNNTITMIILIIFVAFGLMASDMYVPSLPHIVSALHTQASTAKLTVTFYLLGLSIAPLIFGPMADRFGRRTMLLVAGFMALAGSLMAVLAGKIYFLIIARLVQSIGFGGAIALTRVVASDLFDRSKLGKVAAMISLSVSFGPAIAPIIGGYLQVHYGWRSIFALIMMVVLVLLTLVYQKIPETAPSLTPQATHIGTMLDNYKQMLSNRYFVSNIVASSLAIAAIIVYAALSPFILQQSYHLSPIHFGWSMAAVTTMSIASRFLNVQLLKRFSTIRIIKAGLILMALGSGVMLVLSAFKIHYVLAIILPAMVMILGTGLVPSNAMVNTFVLFKDMRGSVSALYGSLMMFGGFIATFIASQVPDTVGHMAILLAAMSTVALIFMMRSIDGQNTLIDSPKAAEAKS